MGIFHILCEEEIKEGKSCDIYFLRTREILKACGIEKRVCMEVRAKELPNRWPWAIFCGLEECIRLFEGMPVSVRSVPEGTLFYPGDPVFEICGCYTDFGHLETSLLGFLCQATGIATAAARCRKAAGEKVLLSFGSRRMHPAISPMVERSAYIGGCDGVSNIGGASLLGIEASGTMPHSLILIFGDTVSATEAFAKFVGEDVLCISLIDTFSDEKFEAVRVAKALGERLYGIRLDTPGSRRGDIYKLIEEIRWELNLRGFSNVKIFLSGGVNEEIIEKLNPILDGYGVGTYISSAKTVDFSLDIVEIEGEPVAKRGKESGRKSLLRCESCFSKKVVPKGEKSVCRCGSYMKDLFEEFIVDGEIKKPLPSPSEIRKYVLSQLEYV